MIRLILTLVGGGVLMALGQGHSSFGLALIPGIALLARAFRFWPLLAVVPAFLAVHVGVWEWAYRGMVPLDGLARIGMELGVGVALALVFVADRLAANASRSIAATLVLPAGWVAFDLLSALFSPGATWGSLAYSFVEPLPVAQVAALVGWTGLTFLAGWSATLALWIVEREERRVRLAGAAVLAGVVALVFAHGLWRLGPRPTPETTTVACVVAPSTYGEDDATLEDVWAYTRGVSPDAAGRERGRARIEESLFEHLALVEEALAEGALLVVVAEANASITGAEEPHWIEETAALASHYEAFVGLGLIVFHPEDGLWSENKLVVVGPSGETVIDYQKATRPPGASHVVGDGVLPIVQSDAGVMTAAICYDLDFPHLVRQAGRARADLLLGPSNDWPAVRDIHARMARLRAVEQGVALVRPTKDGLSLVTDARGRIVAQADTTNADESVLVAELPLTGVDTLYSRIGNAFAWSCTALFPLLALAPVVRRRRRKPESLST